MNRTDRLYAIVDELRSRAPRPVKATGLAERYEVSVRTIERDILALQEAGVPIWARRGPRGGYTVDPRMSLPPLNLTSEEAAALATALAVAGPMPFGDAGRSAARKLAAAMGAEGAERAHALAGRIALTEAQDVVAPGVRRGVEDAVARSVVVWLHYVDAQGRSTQRHVEAHGLFGTPTGWYLVGWCRERNDGRVFRLDRIRDARTTDEPIPERDLIDVLDVPFDVVRPSLVE